MPPNLHCSVGAASPSSLLHEERVQLGKKKREECTAGRTPSISATRGALWRQRVPILAGEAEVCSFRKRCESLLGF